jgi:methionyl-tRNA synthetase
MSSKKIISTAIAYANGAPHIGHAFEFAMTDAIARSLVAQGNDVFFVTGMDEHGQKVEEKAKEKGVPVQTFVEGYASMFRELDRELSVDYDFFVRTSDKQKHYKGAQMLWEKLAANGDIEKRTYSALYCVGCEEFKTEKELNEQGECPAHLKKPEVVEEENYFFKLSRYTNDLRTRIISDDLQILPEARKNEILALLDRGLEDVSFSRPVSKVSWGIPVPGDDTHVMYVWCDALSNYITALGYGYDTFDSERWNDATHVIGKDILRFHAAIWPAMLLSAGLSLPKRILVHGHITSGGQKMSKSLGNVIDPQTVIDLFRAPAGELAGEALRFILLHEIPSFEDGDLTMDSIKTAYTAYLANGIGNLTNRIMKMAVNGGVVFDHSTTKEKIEMREAYDVKRHLEEIMRRVGALDKRIQDEEPFKVIKVDEVKGKAIIAELLTALYTIAEDLVPYMPKTSAKILEYVTSGVMPEKPLFNRLG